MFICQNLQIVMNKCKYSFLLFFMIFKLEQLNLVNTSKPQVGTQTKKHEEHRPRKFNRLKLWESGPVTCIDWAYDQKSTIPHPKLSQFHNLRVQDLSLRTKRTFKRRPRPPKYLNRYWSKFLKIGLMMLMLMLDVKFSSSF